MSKTNKDVIQGLGNEDKLTVQKSLPLFSLWQSELTLAEFKILDIYLSRIDSHKPDMRSIVFDKGELERILGVGKIRNEELKKRLKNLMSNVVEIPDTDEKKGFRLITLFEEAVAFKDETGYWQVTLTCTKKAMKYIFNIENLGYLRYKLRCITSINSRYSYIMFIYLESNRYRKVWEVKIEDLRRILKCDQEETYNEYKRFNDLILKRVYKEIHTKTECEYEYEPVKRGRVVIAVKFRLKTLSDQPIKEIEDCNQITIDQWLDSSKKITYDEYEAEKKKRHDHDATDFDEQSSELKTYDEWKESRRREMADGWQSVLMDFGLRDDEIDCLGIIVKKVLNLELNNSIEEDKKMYEYVLKKVTVAKKYNVKKPFQYLKKAIEKDLG